MGKRVKMIISLSIALVLLGTAFLFISFQSENSVGSSLRAGTVLIEKGDNFVEVAKKLRKEGLVSNSFYFIYYVWTRDYSGKIVAGEYEIAPKMKIPDIVQMLIRGETKPGYVKITFPEGLSAQQMSEKLIEKNLPGKEFLAVVQKPSGELLSQFDFFQGRPANSSLEGYLFPDTYFFAPEATANDIVVKMLKNFNAKFSKDVRDDIARQKKTYFEVLTMASIVEGEVGSNTDRGLVSGIFWKRLEMKMPLQSDATVSYALGGEKKIQHDANDINVDSPYNTYKNKGLPPGPVCNPGIVSIKAAINPTQSNYLYFLNNPKTGETFFSETFEEHVQKKNANGL